MKCFVTRSLLSLFLVATSAILCQASDAVKLPSVFAKHMVLQREMSVPVWGWAEPGEEIHVMVDKATAKTTADKNGKWKVSLPEHAAGGPFKLVVEGKGSRMQLDDVYYGEVWVCSGQSNMAFSVKRTTDAKSEIAAANFPMIRMFTVARNPSKTPQENCKGSWKVCSPSSVGNFSSVGYFFARKLNQELNVPIGMLHTSWGGTRAEAWTKNEALAKEENLKPILGRIKKEREARHRASHLYNGMLAPLIPYAIRGSIWYQGESNRTRAAQYATLFPTMINSWREEWKQGDFPFYFVQLAPYMYNKKNRNANDTLCAEVWDSQFKTMKTVSKTGMAVITDHTTLRDIHPPKKQPVGKRLALWALAKDYGKRDLVYSGPMYKSSKQDGNKMRIEFDHVGGGLLTRDGQGLLEFTIAGEDKKFVPAKAEIKGDVVIVWSKEIKEPKAVRMGWRDIAQPNLINKEGLPASPFRTDDWPLQTDGKY